VPDEAATAVPGARDLLLVARATGVRLAVVTSAGPAWVERSLVESLGLSLDAVDEVVTALDVVDGKPDPAGYALAADRLGVDAALAIAVEDSPAGVLAALGAGVGHVVGVTTTHRSALLDDAGAHTTVPDLRPLVDRVRRPAS
jgi:sugar-phosphatase